jgi:hypothetical protein
MSALETSIQKLLRQSVEDRQTFRQFAKSILEAEKKVASFAQLEMEVRQLRRQQAEDRHTFLQIADTVTKQSELLDGLLKTVSGQAQKAQETQTAIDTLTARLLSVEEGIDSMSEEGTDADSSEYESVTGSDSVNTFDEDGQEVRDSHDETTLVKAGIDTADPVDHISVLDAKTTEEVSFSSASLSELSSAVSELKQLVLDQRPVLDRLATFVDTFGREQSQIPSAQLATNMPASSACDINLIEHISPVAEGLLPQAIDDDDKSWILSPISHPSTTLSDLEADLLELREYPRGLFDDLTVSDITEEGKERPDRASGEDEKASAVEGKAFTHRHMKDWPSEWPVFWEGGDPTGLGRQEAEAEAQQSSEGK